MHTPTVCAHTYTHTHLQTGFYKERLLLMVLFSSWKSVYRKLISRPPAVLRETFLHSTIFVCRVSLIWTNWVSAAEKCLCVGGCGDLVKVVFTNTNLLMFNVQLEKRKKPWTCYADAHYSYAFILSAVWMWSVTHCAVYTHTHTNASRTALVFHSSVYFMCVLEIGRCFTGQIILQPNFHTAVNSHRKCVSSQSMELWSWTSTFFLYFTHLTPRWAGRYYYCTVL